MTQLERAHRRLGNLNDVLMIPMFTEIILDTSMAIHDVDIIEVFALSNLVFCSLFLLEWLISLKLAEDRRAFLTDPGQIISLISCIPFNYVFQAARLFRVFRVLRVFRLATRARRFQGRGAHLLQVSSLVGSTIFAGAMAIRIVEPETFSGFPDALWWSLVTVSTVGYGDITPATGAGRTVASILIIFGVGVVGYIAGFMTSLLSDGERSELAELQASNARLEADLRRLMDHVGVPADGEQPSGTEAT